MRSKDVTPTYNKNKAHNFNVIVGVTSPQLFSIFASGNNNFENKNEIRKIR